MHKKEWQKQRKTQQKRKNKRLQTKSKVQREAGTKKISTGPIHQSTRIKNKGKQIAQVVSQTQDGEQRIVLRSQKKINLPTYLRCADLSRELNQRLGLRSCFCCDNFCSNRGLFLPENMKQDTANQKNTNVDAKRKTKLKC